MVKQTAQMTAAMEEYEKKLEEWMKKTKKAQKMIISTISASAITYVELVADTPPKNIHPVTHKSPKTLA